MQKRTVIFLTLLLFSFPFGRKEGLGAFLWAEPIPVGYYDIAQGKADSALKSALHDTIKGGERFHYGTAGFNPIEQKYYDGTWSFFPLTDRHSDGSIWDMYSPTKRYFPYEMGQSACAMQIEHCLPKSWWGSEDGCKRAYQDLYNLNPSDAAANNNKSNYPPGKVTKGDKFDNGSFRMDAKKSSQYSWICFEPADAYKGDFARTYFYIATAYEDIPWVYGTSPFDAKNAITNDSYLEFQPWLIELLLDWHRQDPVSRKEIERADVISSVQHNRNPYIDYPELVEYIWGDKKGQTVDFSQLVNTASNDYHPLEDGTDLRLRADNVSATDFTLTWSDCHTTYSVDVYTQTTTGHNDTLINLPAITQNLLIATEHGAIRGKVGSNGTQSLTLGSSSTDGTVVIYGLQALQTGDKPLTLRFRASLYNTASSGQLDVYANTTLLQSITDLTRNEDWFEFTLPANTDSVRLAGVGGSTSKRACLQSVFVIQGDETVQHQSLSGYPQQTDNNQIQVSVRSYIDTLYAQVTTTAGLISNELEVTLDSQSTALPVIKDKSSRYKKVLIDGHIYLTSPYSPTPLPLYSL